MHEQSEIGGEKMTGQNPADLVVGARITATITKALPFGALVETAGGMAGLVKDLLDAKVGEPVTIRVDGVDANKHRFSATVK